MALSKVSSSVVVGTIDYAGTIKPIASTTMLIPYDKISRVEPFITGIGGVAALCAIYVQDPTLNPLGPTGFLVNITPAAFKTAWDGNLV